MEQHNFETLLSGIDKQVPFVSIMLFAKGFHERVHIITVLAFLREKL
jgi:hypothetical protein